MSIKSRMVKAELLAPQKTATTLETITTYEKVRDIEVSFSLLSGSATNSNSIIYASSTHTALTLDRGVSRANRLAYGGKVYTITYVNNDGRYSTLFLSLADD